jgi:hypothetical protein
MLIKIAVRLMGLMAVMFVATRIHVGRRKRPRAASASILQKR